MRLELSRQARADLRAIRDYSAARHGPARAIDYLDAIERTWRRLLDHPAIGEDRSDLSGGLRSYPVGEHRVFYLASDDRLLIVRVLHKAMDAGQHV